MRPQARRLPYLVQLAQGGDSDMDAKTVIDELMAARLLTVAAAKSHSSVPAQPGFYAWWQVPGFYVSLRTRVTALAAGRLASEVDRLGQVPSRRSRQCRAVHLAAQEPPCRLCG